MILQTAFYVTLIVVPLRSLFRYGRTATAAVLVAYTTYAVLTILLFLNWKAPLAQFALWGFLAWIAVSFYCAVKLLKGYRTQILFLLFTIFNLQTCIVKLASVLINLHTHSVDLAVPKLSGVLISFSVLLAYSPVMWYLFVHLFGRIIDAGIGHTYWKSLTLLSGLLFLYTHTSSYSGVPRSAPYTLHDALVILLLSLMVLLSTIVCLLMLLRISESLREETRVRIARKQLYLQREQGERLAQAAVANTALRRDTREKLDTLRAFVKAGDSAGLLDYLSQTAPTTPCGGDAPLCRNYTLDVILRHFITMAEQSGVHTDVLVNIPQQLAMSDQELCILFGNLVENAVEACQRQQEGVRYLTIRTNYVGSQLVLMIENSYDNKLHCDHGTYYSSKHKGEGIGISSARNLVERSGGTFKVRAGDGVFKVNVLLNF